LAPEPIAAAYASPFPYTRQTAEVIAADRGLVVQPHVLVRDVDFGMLSAFMAQFAATDTAALARWWAEQEPGMRFPGGESLGALRRRVRRFMNQMADRHPEAGVLVATHDSTMRMAALLARGLGDDHHFDPGLAVAPASLSIVHVTLGQVSDGGGIELTVHGDANHLIA
jgi:broad specificity phosphatase PhoE